MKNWTVLFIAITGVLLTGNTKGKGSNSITPKNENPSFLEVFESHRAPAAYTKLEMRPQADFTMTLQIGVKNLRLENSIDELLETMSDPDHPKFRPHLNDNEYEELSKPDSETIHEVELWLQSHNFDDNQIKWTTNKDWISLENVPLKKVEKMLNTTYAVYRHQDGDHVIRTERYSLPKRLHQHIDLVQPTTMFGQLHKQRAGVQVIEKMSAKKTRVLLDPAIPNTCSDPYSVTNNCLRQLYKTEGYNTTSSTKNAIGITAYLKEAASQADAQTFLKAQRTDQVGKSFVSVSVNGGTNPQKLDPDQIARQLGVEANLDVQTTLGFTLPTKNIFYTTAGSPPFNPDANTPQNSNEPYLEWLTFILNQPIARLPKVITTSYGDNEQTVPISYARRVCSGFGALGARGVSVIFSSGDFGVGKTGNCLKNDDQKTATFLPTFPASCPYVTSVGATERFAPEVATSDKGIAGFNSGGGFSNYFKTPTWQQKDVQRYLQYVGPTKYRGLFNPSGRGIPDVSAQGSKYVIAYQNQFMTVGGTSASAPTFAGVIALLNDYSLSIGGAPLGYLNPWLYKVGRTALNDVIRGSSSGCGTVGFNATEGWDPVTGLGTPDFKKLQQLVRAARDAGLRAEQVAKGVHLKNTGKHTG